MKTADQIVTEFVEAWKRADVEELLDFFADDAVWHPMPLEPVVGKAALRTALTTWLSATQQLDVVIHHQVSDGHVVMHERTDSLVFDGQRQETPVGAAFEVDDGLITAWREYFDMSPYAS